jgi:hypothetical protein
MLSENSEEIIILNDFLMDNKEIDMFDHKINSSEYNIFLYESRIKKNNFKKIDGNATLIVTRLRGSWHKIYFNDILIGTIGDLKNARMNIWNETYKFTIPKELIKEENVLQFETYSNYKIGYGTTPIMITSVDIGNILYNKLKFGYSDLYTIVIVIIVAISLIEILVFIFSGFIGNDFFIFPIIILIGSVFLLDYTVFNHAWISNLYIKKIMLFSLYFAVYLISVSFNKLFKSKIIIFAGSILIISTLIGIVLSKNMLSWNNYYTKINIILIITIGTWIYYSFIEYKKNRDIKIMALMLGSILLIIPSLVDTFTVIYNTKNQRIGVFGMLFFAIILQARIGVEVKKNKRLLDFS